MLLSFKNTWFIYGAVSVFILASFVATHSEKVEYDDHYISRELQYSSFVAVDNTCSSNEDCEWYPEKTFCDNATGINLCSCNNQHVQIETPTGEKSCEPVRNELGQECVDTKQCTAGIPGQLSDCLVTEETSESIKTCQCKGDAVKGDDLDHVCYPKINNFFDNCTTSSQCRANMGPESACIQPQGFCYCTPGVAVPTHHGNDEGDRCLSIRNELGMECEMEEQCTFGLPGEYSDCMYDVDDEMMKCLCQDGLGIPNSNGTTCLYFKAELGEPCENNSQCQEGESGEYSICPNKICVCRDDAVSQENEKICRPKATLVGDECKVDAQCTANIGSLSQCISGYCSCIDGAVSNLEGIEKTKCIPGGIKLGEECIDMAQCPGIPGTSSTCRAPPNRSCGCLAEYTSSENFDDCLQIQNNTGAACKETVQCRKGSLGGLSECFQNTCRCTDDAINYEPSDNQCRPKAVTVGDSCQTDTQCSANLELSHCIDGACTCDSGAAPSENKDKCLALRGLGESCSDGSQCSHIPNGVCQETCKCDEGYVEHPAVANTCMKLATIIGDSCKEDITQCKPLSNGGVVCNVNTDTCQCPAAIPVESLDKTRCLRVVDALDGVCEENQQCQTNGALCDDGHCKCDTDSFVEWNQKCLAKRSEIDQACDDDIQCSFIGQGKTVKCVEDTCQCPGESEYSPSYSRCVNLTRLGEVCQFHDECQFGVNYLTYCLGQSSSEEKRCTCTSGAFPYSGNCWVLKFIDQDCENDEECWMTPNGPAADHRGMECKSGKCACESGLQLESSQWGCSAANNVRVSLLIAFISLWFTFIF